MCELTDYLKSLNPGPEDQSILIYGSKYRLWKKGVYMGIATWTQDENIGDSFQIEKNGTFGGLPCKIYEVLIPDTWELVITKPV